MVGAVDDTDTADDTGLAQDAVSWGEQSVVPTPSGDVDVADADAEM